MPPTLVVIVVLRVALLAEGVDRNQITGTTTPNLSSRPPRGGRG